MITLLSTSSADIDVNAVFDFITGNLGLVLRAGLIALVGFLAYKMLLKVVNRLLGKANTDPQVKKLAVIGFKSIYLSLLFITVCGTLNIEISSFLAVFSVAGVAVSLAVKDSLTDVAGALQIQIAKPYRVGDFVNMGGETGTVAEIGFAYTTLLTTDNHKVMVPNSIASNEIIHNYAKSDTRRLDLMIPIAYEADRNLAKSIIRSLVENHPAAQSDPEPLVRIGDLGDSSVNITVRVWCKNADYFNLKFDLTEQILDAFDEQGVEIPYNKIQVQVRS